MLVVNTCAFIDSAKEESIDAILEMAAHKKRRPLLAAGGDRLSRASGIATSCRQEIPEIDAVLGTGEVPQILEAIGGRDSGRLAVCAIGAPLTLLRDRRSRRQRDRSTRSAANRELQPTSTTPKRRAC